MESQPDFYALKAALDWQIELGATEAICDAPINRFDLPKPEVSTPEPIPTKGARHAPPPRVKSPEVDPVAVAKTAASGAQTLDALKAAVAGFELCDLKRGARNTVFADGNPAARVMIVGEAPGREEDIEGKPFVGPAGRLLDKMLAAIGLDRASDDPLTGAYITNILPWRPPQNRDPEKAEMDMMLPFVARHVELAAPEFVVLMGNIACQACLGQRGITRLRGKWTNAFDRHALPMFHPAYLLRNPHAKREAWADLLSLKAKMGVQS